MVNFDVQPHAITGSLVFDSAAHTRIGNAINLVYFKNGEVAASQYNCFEQITYAGEGIIPINGQSNTNGHLLDLSRYQGWPFWKVARRCESVAGIHAARLPYDWKRADVMIMRYPGNDLRSESGKAPRIAAPDPGHRTVEPFLRST